MNASAPPYRDATNEVADHAKRLLEGQRATDLSKLGKLYQNRMTRIGFGWAGILAAALALPVIGLAEEGQVRALGVAWSIALSGGLLSYLLAGHKFRRYRERYNKGISDDPYGQVLRLTQAKDTEEDGPFSLDRIDDLRLDSHRLPLLVGALLLPLTTIVLFLLFCGSPERELALASRYGLLYTAHVHIYAAIAAYRFPKVRKPGAMIGIAAMFGVLPFVFSALVVLVVASVIVSVYYLPMSWWVDRESQWIAIERQERQSAQELC